MTLLVLFAPKPADGYYVEVDWANDGLFDVSDNVSADFISIAIDRGFASVMDHVAKVGRCTLLMKNKSKQYSPYIVASVLPRRKMQVREIYSGLGAWLFTGFIESIAPDADTLGARRVVIECVDSIALLQLHESRVALQIAQTGDQIASVVVSDCYTPPGTFYDVDPDTFAYGGDRWTDDFVYGLEHQRALRALQDIVKSDAGWFYVRRDGYAVFENRHHRILDSTIRATFSNTMSKFQYRKAAASVYNHVEVKAHPRAIGSANVVLWSLETVQAIHPGQTVTVTANFRDPNNKSQRIGGKTVIAPVATTDYLVNGQQNGGGGDLTANFTVVATVYANNARIVVSNNGSAVGYIGGNTAGSLLQLRGLPVYTYDSPIFVKEDAASQLVYQKRAWLVDAVLQNDLGVAETMAQYLLDLYKMPLDEISGIGFYANRSATFQGYARDLEIGDQITLTEDQTGVAAFNCFINAIRHTIKGKVHYVEVDIEKAQTPKAGAGGYWMLGVNQLDIDARLPF